jgi:hypothetical protein
MAQPIVMKALTAVLSNTVPQGKKKSGGEKKPFDK